MLFPSTSPPATCYIFLYCLKSWNFRSQNTLHFHMIDQEAGPYSCTPRTASASTSSTWVNLSPSRRGLTLSRMAFLSIYQILSFSFWDHFSCSSRKPGGVLFWTDMKSKEGSSDLIQWKMRSQAKHLSGNTTEKEGVSTGLCLLCSPGSSSRCLCLVTPSSHCSTLPTLKET